MTTALTMGQRCRRGLTAEGPVSDDPRIQHVAMFQRDLSQMSQAILLSFGTGYASWLYNDPYRKDGESLPKSFYAVAGSAGAALGAVIAYRIRKWCLDPKNSESWIAHPFIAALGAATGPTLGVAIAGVVAEQLSKQNSAQFEINDELLAQWYARKSEISFACYKTVYEGREAFTDPSCTICEQQDYQSKPIFYQAYFVPNFSTYLCENNISQWPNLENFTDLFSTDPWPCREPMFNASVPNYMWRIYVSQTLKIWPPMSLVVSPYNDSCLLAEGSGTKIDGRPVTDFCWLPDYFQLNPDAVCSTPEWMEFATNFSDFYRLEAPNTTFEPISQRVHELLYGDRFSQQFYGGIGVVTMLSLIMVIRQIAKKCAFAKQPRPLEMENLAEVEEQELEVS